MKEENEIELHFAKQRIEHNPCYGPDIYISINLKINFEAYLRLGQRFGKIHF